MRLFGSVLAAQARLKGVTHVTPVMTSHYLNERVGAEVFLKCENLQRGGSFKLRGAYNAMAQLEISERARGVVTHSSGNHGQAVALAGQLLKLRTTIAMPNTVVRTKRLATEGYGAQVAIYDPMETTPEMAASALMTNGHAGVLIHPFDDERVVAGAGTVALELFEEVGELDMVMAPCGGGGLLSGTAIATRGRCPRCKVVGVEPALADDATRSFYSGTLQRVNNPPTIADGARVASLGYLTFKLVRAHVDEMVTVSEGAIVEAVRFYFERMKLVVEPSGALTLAALLSGAIRPKGRVGIIVSGGNADPAAMATLLSL